MITGQVFFVVNLLQDINVHRPLVYLASNNLKLKTHFLVSAAFRKRDKTGLWQYELNEIAKETNSTIDDFENEFQALTVLQKAHGVLIAASESHLDAHKQVRDLFHSAPSQYVKITLQHGFECVGFLQSRDQDFAHGKNITFAADIICGWCSPDRLVSIAPSQRYKLRVTGPASLLDTKSNSKEIVSKAGRDISKPIGLVCENMHSPRLNAAGDFKTQFFYKFEAFCVELHKEGLSVTLRPHPGGQYVIKNNVSLPTNVLLENRPIYRVDLSKFAYGISAPSSVLIDMVLAGIPTAVWQDREGVMDLGNYEGLTKISTIEDWLDFAHRAVADPGFYLERQQAFLKKQKLMIDKGGVHQAFTSLLQAVTSLKRPLIKRLKPQEKERILIFAPGYIPTLQLSFIKPLADDIAAGLVIVDVVSEVHLNSEFKGEKAGGLEARQWIKARIDSFRPTIAIFCRWAGPHTAWMQSYFTEKLIPVVFHLDDDLLAIPKEIALEKWDYHNRPERIRSVRHLLDHANLVYCSTEPLRHQLQIYDAKAPLKSGEIYCSAMPVHVPTARPVKKVGYMGIGHEHDLEIVLPAIVSYLKRNPEVSFEIFGTIPVPSLLVQFGDRVKHAPKIENYDEFLERLIEYQWDIGICPLAQIPFNLLKANTKWVEYTAAGVAVVASRGTVYDQCCSDGCGILAHNVDEWLDALEFLTHKPSARIEMVNRAQKRLAHDFSPNKLRDQVLAIIADARNHSKPSAFPVPSKKDRVLMYPRRVLFVSNSHLPTLQLSFIKPLASLVAAGDLNVHFLSEEQMKRKEWSKDGFSTVKAWINHLFERYQPELVVFCRYSGPFADYLLDLCRKRSIPTVYHIDDDLLGIPIDIGVDKHRYHNEEKRLDTVRLLLNQTDLIYASTYKIKQHLVSLNVGAPVVAGDIYCSGMAINRPEERPVRKIGYMASADHGHNLTNIIGALVRLLRKHPNVKFEFFGSISAPPEFAEFGDRISHAPPISDYEQFLQKFAEYQWDIGICPLTTIHFNMMKANTKWVEYTSVGAAVVASKDTVYDECCANECGLLASSEEEWLIALDSLVSDPLARFRQVIRAQKKLQEEYSVERLRNQVLDVFTKACKLAEKSS